VAGKVAVGSRGCWSVNEVAAIAEAIILQARIAITVAFAKGNAGLNSHVSRGGRVLERKRVGTALGDIASGVVECSERRRARRGKRAIVLRTARTVEERARVAKAIGTSFEAMLVR